MEEAEKIKVLIVDDHQVVRQGLRTFLEMQDDITVVGEAQDGRQALELVRQLAPDVVLMDLVMPHMDGITATQQVRALSPATKVIALTSFSEDDKVFPAIQAGAASYLLKDVTLMTWLRRSVPYNGGGAPSRYRPEAHAAGVAGHMPRTALWMS
jgi:NarL family two-component system response regulator LiaR